jgi:hypothetical protein
VLPLHDHSETGYQVQLTVMCSDDFVTNLLICIGLLKGPTFCLQHADAVPNHGNHTPVLRIRIRRIRMFLGLPDPHPLVTSMDTAPDPVPVPAPDPSIIKQK